MKNITKDLYIICRVVATTTGTVGMERSWLELIILPLRHGIEMMIGKRRSARVEVLTAVLMMSGRGIAAESFIRMMLTGAVALMSGAVEKVVSET